MDLPKTTILPTDDAVLAAKLFGHLVFEEPVALLVVLGTGPDADTFVQRADKLAGQPEEPRRVVWVRKPEIGDALIRSLKGKKVDAGAKGFSMSALSAIVRDVVAANEDVPDLARVFQLWANAEAEEGARTDA